MVAPYLQPKLSKAKREEDFHAACFVDPMEHEIELERTIRSESI